MELSPSGLIFWKKYPTLKRQILASLSGFCGCISCGVTLSFTGILLPHIREYVDEEQGSWIAGCNVLSTPFGILAGSVAMRKFGRKAAIVCPSIPWIIGFLTLSMASEFWTFFVGTALVGLNQGFFSCVSTVYTVENAEPKLRGVLGSLMGLFFPIGVFIGHTLGMVFPWRISFRLYAIFPALCLLFSFFLIESLNWLTLKGRLAEAEVNFFYLRGVNAESQHEFECLQRKRTENMVRTQNGVVKNLFSASFFKPFLITTLMFMITVASGTDILIYYGIDFLNSVSKTIDHEKVLMVINAVRICASLTAALLIKKLKRKLLFFLSTLCTVFFLVSISVSINYALFDKLLIINLCLYIAAANLGIIPLPWIMLAELFPQILRDIGNGIVQMCYYFLSFVLVELSPVLIKTVGISATLWIFIGFTLTCAALLYFVMPETEEYTLQEVEDKVYKIGSVKMFGQS